MRRRSLLTSGFNPDPTTGRGVFAGYEVVDLGLPSGTLWATCNVGASTETEIGNYYRPLQDFASQNRNYYIEPIPDEYDTATQVMGSNWCIPSYEQIEELISHVQYDSTTGRHYVPGTEKYIYFPKMQYIGYNTWAYWTSSPAPDPNVGTGLDDIYNESHRRYIMTAPYDSLNTLIIGSLDNGTASLMVRAVVKRRTTFQYASGSGNSNRTFAPGTYLIECWGGQGGTTKKSDGTVVKTGGKGGYILGVVTLQNATKLYIKPATQGTGTAGKKGSFSGGYFGGGLAASNYSYQYVGSGGGASDVRIGSDSIYSRIIVAGGGGGASYSYSGARAGFDASGTYGGKKGTYESGGASGGSGYPGTFGYGGGGRLTDYNYGASGGGGGWYGGGSGRQYSGNSNDSSGGGGSSYAYTSSTAGYYPSGCLLDSSYYMRRCFMPSLTTANDYNPSIDGERETGHEGGGFVRITKLF